MLKHLQPNAAEQLFPTRTEGSPALVTIVPWLVGYTIEEVERELILSSLAHFRGNRTWTANVLGISIRTLRNKIHEYTAQGVAVARPQTVTETPQELLYQQSNLNAEERALGQHRPS